MKRMLLAAIVAAAIAPAVCGAKTKIDLAVLHQATRNYLLAVEVGRPGEAAYRFIYADRQNHVHVFAVKEGYLERVWETATLGSPVTSLFVADLYGDGEQKLVIATSGGRILIHGMDDYDLEWENLQLRYARVDYLTHANLDSDRQEELVALADGRLHIVDGYNKTVQWFSTVELAARHIVVGNVDDDPQLEIVLNGGKIVDGRFYNIQFQTDAPFGDRVALVDITGDGHPEVFGEFLDRTLRVFDVWAGREVW